ncbi:MULTISPECIES: LLM class flavin-dependent oxidoreductase [Nocardia]|uniref:LLM class flavin-dependent oxidoreductase n=1 Tax=Nocardia nova TaxID=37330 RepID=A0A2T2YX71_9NOCA|nr:MULTISPECIES: LLM class flavin-dependent oxidoreductase [Nocardia]MBF6243355.1 LLM class flavin-dependent oxidoreductase [Nocardia elegans]PSR60127.1 LLM class flavin-dependent oxidoreductase [Nocardia nova]
MTSTTVVEAARSALGAVGVTLPVSFTRTPSAQEQRSAGRRLEEAGVRAVWTNEVIGKDAFAHLAVLLAATERMTAGTCVANIWARAPQTAHGAAAYLAQAYPGRFVLGLGVGYPQQADSVGREFGSPLTTMRDYVAGMDEQTWPPAPETPYPRILAANGPKMLSLAADIADGALPAGLPAEHTARARNALGPGKLLVVGQSVVVDDDRGRARAAAREVVRTWAARPSFRATLVELGYPAIEIDELGDGVVDALVAHGRAESIVVTIRAQLDAGADHVVLLPPIGTEFGSGIEQLVSIAPALRELG